MPEPTSDNIINQTRYADGGARITLQIQTRGPLDASAYVYLADVVRAMDELGSQLSKLADPDPPF